MIPARAEVVAQMVERSQLTQETWSSNPNTGKINLAISIANERRKIGKLFLLKEVAQL